MDWIRASSEHSKRCLGLVLDLQKELVEVLERFSVLMGNRVAFQNGLKFEKVEWMRDGGRHGGGVRFQAPLLKPSAAVFPAVSRSGPSVSNESCFERPFNAASSNISQVQYEDEPEKKLAAATALSSIVHPSHPLLPSLHLHLSWTEYKSGSGYWRIMADLNPSHALSSDTLHFQSALQEASKGNGSDLFRSAIEQGDRYFYIPALDRTRGVFHFYLEEYHSGSFDDDFELASRSALAAIRSYGQILESKVAALSNPTAAQLQTQLDYHTLYFFQVLTLDRGTTSGLLVHADNDVGILGSLPSRVNRNLLENWKHKVPQAQQILVEDLVRCLGNGEVADVSVAVKQALANAVRTFYSQNPAALELQARGNSIPPTIGNHIDP